MSNCLTVLPQISDSSLTRCGNLINKGKTVRIIDLMENQIVETHYPLSFREEDAIKLGAHLKNRHSVVLVGMKRVGISTFLRFFLYHGSIVKTYIDNNKKHLFIPVDLNDLVEREISPFWTLTLKRIADAVENSRLSKKTKNFISRLFLDSIQTQDRFFTLDCVRRSIGKLVEDGILPTIFFVRFDRMKDVVTPEFFDNLQGLKDASHQKLSYVFTSYRPLDVLAPHVFSKASLAMFAYNMFIQPAQKSDAETIYEFYTKRYKLNLPKTLKNALFELVDGYTQYLQLSLILLHESKNEYKTKDDLFKHLIKDERITLQSEELWENLLDGEKETLLFVLKKHSFPKTTNHSYLQDTGFFTKTGAKYQLFSPLFQHYVENIVMTKSDDNSADFSKKENVLFNYLRNNTDEICERESIIETVWPEVEALGVSDWAVDRLVARVRNKLKLQKATYKIQTIKTRGYKLVNESS